MSKALQSLREREVQQLLKLQELFHSQYLTEELLNDMIGLLVRFAESAPQGQHPLRLYFMQKIRFVLSRPEVMKGLEKEVREEQKIAEKDRLAEEAKHNYANGKHKKVGFVAEGEEKDRSAKIDMQMQVMKGVEEGMNQFREGLGRETELRQKKETEINQLVNKQEETLEQRRANRRKKLRKRSANLTEKETIIEAAPPIPMAELKQVQKELNQTYQRFTRLTQNKLTQELKKSNKGRVKFQIQEQVYEEEELFDQQPEAKKEEKPQVNEPQASPAPPPRRETTTVQYKTFDQNKGRVTVRNNQYEEIDEEEF